MTNRKGQFLGGFSTYEVLVEDNGGCSQLKCVSFVQDEDLGDGIVCCHEGQTMWVAHYHMFGFTEVTS